MGTWNTGPFDNDSAHDAVNALVNGTFCMAQFLSLIHISEPTRPY